MCVMVSSSGLPRMMSLLPSFQCGFDEMLRFQVLGEWVFSFRGMGFLTVFKLDVEEEHEDEDDTGCWGRT